MRRILPLLVLLGIVGFVAASCSSLSKPDLEQELLTLEKNAAFAAAGLRRIQLEPDPESGLEAQELVFVHLVREGQPSVEEAPAYPVVLVHGTPSTLFTWTELAAGSTDFEGLVGARDVYAIEVLGHGVAPGTADPLTFEVCARFVAKAIRALELQRVHLVGQSYGGEFAWRVAVDHPELVASLVLMDSSGYARREQDWLPEEIQMRENALAGIGWLLNSRKRVSGALEPHFDALPPDRVEEFYLVCENKVNWNGMIDLARDENGERQADIAKVEVPTLIVWGAEDLAYPVEIYGERFAEDIAGAELILVDTGHYPHEERPASVAAALSTFFQRAEVRD